MRIRKVFSAAACLLLGLTALFAAARAEEVFSETFSEAFAEVFSEAFSPARPVIEPPTGEKIVYGQSLTESALVGGMASDPVTGEEVEGYFVWANGDFVPGVGLQMCLCEFVPTGFDAEYYLSVSFRAEVEVGRIPALILERPASLRHIQYGETVDKAGFSGGICVDLSGTEIDGVWRYADGGVTPPAGRLSAAAVFVPEDSFHYEEARCAVEVECDPCTPGVAVSCTRAFPGEPLSSCELDGWAAGLDGALIPGAFAFRDGSLIPGDSGAYDVTFTPDDSVNYLPVTVKVTVVFGLRNVSVEAVLEAEEGQRIEEGVLTWRAFDDEGVSVAGSLIFDERFASMRVVPGESIGAVFVPLNRALYGEIPVSVRVLIR